jgi:hypothetical protein
MFRAMGFSLALILCIAFCIVGWSTYAVVQYLSSGHVTVLNGEKLQLEPPIEFSLWHFTIKQDELPLPTWHALFVTSLFVCNTIPKCRRTAGGIMVRYGNKLGN